MNLSILEGYRRHHRHGSYEPRDPGLLPGLLRLHGYLVGLLSTYGAVLQGTSRGPLKIGSYSSSLQNVHLSNFKHAGIMLRLPMIDNLELPTFVYILALALTLSLRFNN